tara:strand:+ start:253 stop:585 length:333 start_codon:yes stop_codon:yes gene_type:complete
MKKTKSIITISLILLFLNACSSVVEGLGGTKKKGSDEFLVEKKSALVLPPSFGELPEPGAKVDDIVASNKKNQLSIKEKISQGTSLNTNTEDSDTSISIQKSIIEKINEK